MTFRQNVSIPENLYISRRFANLDKIKHLYFNEQLNLNEIYKITGVSPPTIRKIFKENGIHMRTRSEAIKLGKKINSN
jgi:Fic family protein